MPVTGLWLAVVNYDLFGRTNVRINNLTSQIAGCTACLMNSVYARGGLSQIKRWVVPPAQGTFGNMPYDALRGKAFHNWDFSATKTWTFKERYRAQFRAEFFNLLNRTGYTPPGVNLASPATFGDSTATPDSGNVLIGSGPRKIQLGLKIIF